MEVLTGRAWPWRGLDRKARKTREYVLQKCWQDCAADMTGRRDATPPNTLALPKSVFSYAMKVMDKVKDGMKGFEI